jgi:hypothetical protein
VFQHPLYSVLEDLLGRIGIPEGAPVSDDEDPSRDPFDDQALPIAEAARRKGVTVQALHQAVDRGAVVGGPARPGSSRRVVSWNSVERWRPRRVRAS